MTVTLSVKQYYDEFGNGEWKRLVSDPFHKLEYTITMHHLKRYLPESGLILDAGGGPGRYSIDLAKRGYAIILLDSAPKLLELAKKQIKKAKVENNIKEIIEGSISNLSMFEDNTFDSVLCLGGTLNHILDANERDKAANELIRVAKDNTYMFVSVISRLSAMITKLTYYPDEVQHIRRFLETGDHTIEDAKKWGFAPAHTFLPEELRKLFETKGVQIIDIVGLEGLSSAHWSETNNLFKNKRAWNAWVDVIIKTSNHPCVAGISDHMMIILKKNTINTSMLYKRS